MKNTQPELKRALKNRHVQLIALGGAIGTGLFLGSAGTIQMAGPAVLISYALGGFVAFLIMRQLGEMMAQEPVAGSFSNLAHKYWGDFPGLLSGWNYWILYVLVGMSELTAVAVYDLTLRCLSLGMSWLVLRESPALLISAVPVVILGYLGAVGGLFTGASAVRELRHAGIVRF